MLGATVLSAAATVQLESRPQRPLTAQHTHTVQQRVITAHTLTLMWLRACCVLTLFSNGLSLLALGVRVDQSTNRPRNVPMTSRLRRMNPTLSLMLAAAATLR